MKKLYTLLFGLALAGLLLASVAQAKIFPVPEPAFYTDADVTADGTYTDIAITVTIPAPDRLLGYTNDVTVANANAVVVTTPAPASDAGAFLDPGENNVVVVLGGGDIGFIRGYDAIATANAVKIADLSTASDLAPFDTDPATASQSGGTGIVTIAGAANTSGWNVIEAPDGAIVAKSGKDGYAPFRFG